MAAPEGPSRQYLPLAGLVLVAFLALAVLPSALLRPQTPPTATLEYAPVPPSGERSPPGGNFGGLGLGSSGTIGIRAPGEPAVLMPGRAGAGRSPRSKLCVGSPPRQTEDRMSPPCVAHFDGDNFGAVARGVTRDEVRVVVYLDAGFYDSGQRGENSPPGGTYCDLGVPAPEGGTGCWVRGTTDEHAWVRWMRSYTRYFNHRFQTYGRTVRPWVYWGGAATPEAKRAVAADHLARIAPFAALDLTATGNDEAYTDVMARAGTLLFLGKPSESSLPGEVYRRYAPRLWGFFGDVEHWALGYTSFVCRRVAGHPVAHATAGIARDGSVMNGKARRYALLSTTDPNFPNVQLFAALAKRQLRGCGVDGVELTYPQHGMLLYTNSAPSATAAAQNVATMRQHDVTTILWLGGGEFYTGIAADQARYYPEVVFAGDGEVEVDANARLQSQSFWRNAWGVSNQLRVDGVRHDPGFQACLEGDPGLPERGCAIAAQFYRAHFSLYKAIQVAGPRLSAAAIDQGMHAIPHVPGADPYTAACFYEQADYTCVKDGAEWWWDPAATTGSVSGVGCYRMVHGGRRHLPSSWPRADDAFANPSDPCSAYGSRDV